MTQAPSSFTGRKRRLANRRWVRFADNVARWFITISGIGTIVAVLLVFAFLLSVVAPLFWPGASLVAQPVVTIPALNTPGYQAVNEYRTLAWTLDSHGTLRILRADSGEQLAEQSLWEEAAATAIAWDEPSGSLVVGFADGSLRLGKLSFETRFLDETELPANLPTDASTDLVVHDQGVLERTTSQQWRWQSVAATIGEAREFAAGPISAIELLGTNSESGSGTTGPLIAAGLTDGAIVVATTKVNAVTGELRLGTPEALPNTPTTAPLRLLLTARGDNLCAAYADGLLMRWNISESPMALVERVEVVNRPGLTLTACEWAIGRETLVCGDSAGHLSAWFRVRNTANPAATELATNSTSPPKELADASQAAPTSDGFHLQRVHDLGRGPASVTKLAASPRSRIMAAAFADGSLQLLHLTTARQLTTLRGAGSSAEHHTWQHLSIAPKEDAVFAWGTTELAAFELNPGHPEVSWSSLFRPVWYEGYPQPAHVWQSSFAGVESEMKLGLWPLVFGTLKATAYSLLFGAPIALLAAIHTSEFLSARARARVKPVIEMMAGLPSVVLGFLAALVLAPWVEQSVGLILSCLVTVPLTLSLSATAWTLLPASWAPKWARFRFAFLILAMVAGVTLGWVSADALERFLFGGSLTRWLEDRTVAGTAGWLLLMLPLTTAAVVLFVNAIVNPWLMRRLGSHARPLFAVLNAIKFLLAALIAIAVAWLLSLLLTQCGWDPRGSVLGSYVQRNALVVGFVMGFAIIPLIYTLADDALAAVPQHLRAASLGAGATPWQTAVRIVIPTAMSGLFSALMIGLGRAVGETMIVLMAGGNTPVTDWNPFNGFRTLSANLAVELPEAVRGSTHFRTLYLAALTLFLLTFLVNTAAEWVRNRYRRRASAL